MRSSPANTATHDRDGRAPRRRLFTMPGLALSLTLRQADAGMPQTITFPAVADRRITDSPIQLQATAASGLPVSFAVVSAPAVATVEGHTVTLQAGGAVTIRASQAGNSEWEAAADVYRTFLAVAESAKFVQVDAGWLHTAAVRGDGTLWTWGANHFGQLGDDSGEARPRMVQTGSGTNWISVSAGGDHTLGIRRDGTLWAWGRNTWGQLGDGTYEDRPAPVPVGAGTEWAAVSAGSSFSAAIDLSGRLWVWGSNDLGEIGGLDPAVIPVPFDAATDWVSVSAGGAHMAALKTDGSLWLWGHNFDGQLGNGTWQNRRWAERLGDPGDWAAVAAGREYTAAIRTDGTLWTWGSGRAGRLGHGDLSGSNVPRQVGTATNWECISAEHITTTGIRRDGSLWFWGGNLIEPGQLTTNHLLPVEAGTDLHWRHVTAGEEHIVALTAHGTLHAWGLNDYGQLGDEGRTDRRAPVQSGYATDWAAVAAEDDVTCAVRRDGTLWQIADRPFPMGFASDWLQPFPNSTNVQPWVLALRRDGALHAWGQNVHGQLGDGTNTNRFFPDTVQIPGTWTTAAAGDVHSIAVRSDGSLWTWGRNQFGQLGTGDAVSRNTPAQIGPERNWTAAAAGAAHTLAIAAGGSLWSWGRNDRGQLGDSSYTNHSLPALVAGGGSWALVSAGGSMTIGIRQEGTLWTWGDNDYAQLGDGWTSSSRTSPFRIGAAGNWSGCSTGGLHAVALQRDGSLWAWGENYSGQVGDGSTERTKRSPVRVGSVANWAAVSAGNEHTSGIRTDGTLWTWGRGDRGQLGVSEERIWPRRSTQVIDFPALPAARTGQSLALSATADSGLPVIFAVTGPASLEGSYLVCSGPGTVWVTASQPGDAIWRYAEPVSRSLTVLSALQSWRLTHFGSAANAGAGTDTADPDQDTLPNLAEWVMGTAPQETNAAPYELRRSKGGYELCYPRSLESSKTGTVITVEYSSHLNGGPWSEEGVTSTIRSTDGVFDQMCAELPGTGADRLFARLRITAPGE